MKLEQMKKEVARLIDDQYYDPITIQEFLNKAVVMCAFDVDIPEFKRVTTIETIAGKAYTYLNEQIPQFGGRVRRVKYNGFDLKVYSSLDELLDNYEDLTATGAVEATALEGRVLWYAKIPEEATSLLLLYFQNPEPLAAKVNEELLWLPEACQLKVICHGAASLIWRELEEEDSGQPMANRYRAIYEEGIVDFKAWIARNRQNLTYSHWSN
jgi:hypothetical protein